MKRILPWLVVAAIGCGEAATPVATTSVKSATASPPNVAESNAIGEPAAVAERFVRAIVAGDRDAAARELTPNAAARVAREPGLLQPLGLSAVELRVGEVRLLGPGEAAVQVVIVEEGQGAPEEVGCLLKNAEGVWGVCGLASDAGDGGDPVVIGFEAPPQTESPLVDASNPAAAPRRTAQGDPGSSIR
ncbi:MAG: hypothetical protein AAF805_07965 [Planctomycetota bacterium]